MRGLVGCGGVSANELYSCAHGAQINFGDLTPYLTYGVLVSINFFNHFRNFSSANFAQFKFKAFLRYLGEEQRQTQYISLGLKVEGWSCESTTHSHASNFVSPANDQDGDCWEVVSDRGVRHTVSFWTFWPNNRQLFYNRERAPNRYIWLIMRIS